MAVATNRPSCGGAAFARERGIPLGELSQKSFASAEERDAAMRDFFVGHGVELVVDAGYDRVHSQPFLEAFADRIINVHPSLLPEFGAAWTRSSRRWPRGVEKTGATVHLVTAELDAGPILLQEAVPILRRRYGGDSARSGCTRRSTGSSPQAIRMMEARLANSPSVG